MNVRIAYLAPIGINPVGKVVNKNDPNTTLRDVMSSSSEIRVVHSNTNPSTGDPVAVPPTTYPTLEEYLVREAVAGYKASFVSATMIITYNT